MEYRYGSFLLYRKLCPIKQKTLRVEAHSRNMKMLLMQPRSAREFRKRNSLVSCL